MITKSGRLIVVSNRLPVVVSVENGIPQLQPSSGGLVTALTSVFRKHRGYWVGWTGSAKSQVASESLRTHFVEFEMVPVFLTEHERKQFYCGFSNEVVWPLFHDLQSRCNFDASYWDSYLRVNQQFADVVAQFAREEDFIWIHDYHLVATAQYLRERGVRSKIAFFQHIPFPCLDIFEKLPWRKAFIEALLNFDVVGLQTQRDRTNFVQCARSLAGPVVLKRHGPHLMISRDTQRTIVGAFPISIDFDDFAGSSALDEVATQAAKIRSDLSGRKVVLGVDRLDYTKGLPEKLRGFREALDRYPDLRRKIILIQVVVPSREDVPRYRKLKNEVERLVSEINGRYTDSGWVPIHFLYRHLRREELIAHYRAADVALVTPLKDGMNLVSKEFCACQLDFSGALILSEFAGASVQLGGGALLVNPNDSTALASALHRALHMPQEERDRRMRRLRDLVSCEDVYHWTEQFFECVSEMPTRRPAEETLSCRRAKAS